jgi:uncharacterized protein YajQ (UPF0234 family)
MAAENSFDVVSKIDMAEVTNAVTQALKEIGQRFDFKGSKSNITQEKDDLIILSDDEYKLKSVVDILQGKLVKRGVPVRNLSYGKVDPALSGTVRQRVTLQQGIPVEKAKEIVKAIKDQDQGPGLYPGRPGPVSGKNHVTISRRSSRCSRAVISASSSSSPTIGARNGRTLSPPCRSPFSFLTGELILHYLLKLI